MSDVYSLEHIKLARISTVVFFIDTQLHAQISMTVQSGMDVSIVASEKKLTRPIEGVKYYSTDIPRAISPIKDLLALFKLYILFRKEKFDIVHSTTPKAGLLCAISGKLAGVPIRIHSFTGQPWVTLSGFKRRLARWGGWGIGRLNKACYADSDSQKQFLVSEKLVLPEKLSVIGEGSLAGVDVSRFNIDRFSASKINDLKNEYGIAKDAMVLLFVGRVVKDKGVVELVDAFKRLCIKNHSLNVNLLMVGPQELTLNDLDIDLYTEFASKVIFTGYTNEPEKFMAISDVLCIPSYREGFGTVVIEAAAMGLPAVGTTIYGLSDAIVDGVTGVLVEPMSVEELESALMNIIADKGFRNSLGQNAKIRARKHFSNEVVNKLVIDEYRVLLNRHARQANV